MATIDSQILRAISAISSWAECSNTNDCAINRLATPLNDIVNAHAFLDAAILVFFFLFFFLYEILMHLHSGWTDS